MEKNQGQLAGWMGDHRVERDPDSKAIRPASHSHE